MGLLDLSSDHGSHSHGMTLTFEFKVDFVVAMGNTICQKFQISYGIFSQQCAHGCRSPCPPMRTERLTNIAWEWNAVSMSRPSLSFIFY